ncbi:DUF6660 family protein [Mucilaginibacter yixingensis]|uniref:DUF6660 family protein n=1 Tax=Mucilaginibacter yixingensis TaxID=1295612 RepID=UPI0034E1CE55
MKWFTILIGLYMTILAILPCRDKDDFAITIHHTTVSKGQQTDQSSCREACSPFCICSCCSVTRSVPRTFTSVVVFEQSIAQGYSELRVEPLRDQVLPIWQPPQLS